MIGRVTATWPNTSYLSLFNTQDLLVILIDLKTAIGPLSHISFELLID